MKIDVVLVTFNRLEKLKKAIQCLIDQTVPFRNLIIVNNNSTDNTSLYLQELQKRPDLPFSLHVINLPENIGGSGGFNAGEVYSMRLNPDWIYVQDDDAYPEKKLIEKFQDFILNHKADKIAAVCTAVLGTSDMQPDIDHRADFSFKYGFIPTRVAHPRSDYDRSFFELNLLSYVGSFINALAIEQVGPMRGDFFIYWDDGEHSLRLSKYGKIICVPSLHVIHESKTPGNDSDGVFSWRMYYNIRNYIFSIKHQNKVAGCYLCARYTLSKFLKGNPAYRKMIGASVRDALDGSLNKHILYRPGYILNNDLNS